MRNVLQTGCLVLGGLFLLYYIGIILYVGIRADFAWIWALGSVFWFALWQGLRYAAGHPDTWVHAALRVAAGLIAVGLVVLAVVGGRIVGGMVAKPERDLDYVIVLGAQVRGTKPSRALRKRLDRALAYAQENPRTMLILSGGQGPDEGISEAECMQQYLSEHGLAEDRMLLEDRSTSTRENLRFSEQYLDKEKDRIGLLSNNFHIYRALGLARHEGYLHISGIPAPSDLGLQPHYVLREVCAVLAELVRGGIVL